VAAVTGTPGLGGRFEAQPMAPQAASTSSIPRQLQDWRKIARLRASGLRESGM
jgi:hypothetical protein